MGAFNNCPQAWEQNNESTQGHKYNVAVFFKSSHKSFLPFYKRSLSFQKRSEKSCRAIWSQSWPETEKIDINNQWEDRIIIFCPITDRVCVLVFTPLLYYIVRALVAVNNEFHSGTSKYNKPNEPTIMFLTFQT